MILQVLVKESEGPVEHLVKIGTSARVLEELRVTSKPAKVKGKAGRRKQKAAVEDLDDEGAEPEEVPGMGPAPAACVPQVQGQPETCLKSAAS